MIKKNKQKSCVSVKPKQSIVLQIEERIRKQTETHQGMNSERETLCNSVLPFKVVLYSTMVVVSDTHKEYE